MSSSLTCCWCRKLTSASLTQHWQLNKVWMWLNTPHVYVCTQWGGPEGTAAPAIVESIWGMSCEDLMPEPESSRVRSPAQTGCWHHTLPTPGGGREGGRANILTESCFHRYQRCVQGAWEQITTTYCVYVKFFQSWFSVLRETCQPEVLFHSLAHTTVWTALTDRINQLDLKQLVN